MELPFKISTTIDYVGQKRTEKVFQIIVTVFAVIGFIWGFVVQQFSQTLLVLAIGVLVAAVVVLPPWPFWRRNPISWQKVQTPSTAQTATTADSKESKDKKKK